MADPARMLPSLVMPTISARADLVTPVTVDHRPFMVPACFSMPPANLSSIREISAWLNFSWLTIWPLLLTSWTLRNSFSPWATIMALVMPNSFSRSSSPVCASIRASVAWSKLLLVAAAMSPARVSHCSALIPMASNLAAPSTSSPPSKGVRLARSTAYFMMPAAFTVSLVAVSSWSR